MLAMQQSNKTLTGIIKIVMLFFIPAAAMAADLPGLSLNAMRVIYLEKDQHGVPVTFSNNTTNKWLLQSSVREMNDQNHEISARRAPFIVLPPLVKTDAQGNLILRVLRTGGEFPSDRESVFYLSVKMIPSVPEQQNNQAHINIAYVNNLRIFYRPSGLAARGTAAAAQRLTFRLDDDRITATNPTAYYIPLALLEINKMAISAKALRVMVPPQGESSYQLPENHAALPETVNVRWRATDEDGNATGEMSQVIKKGSKQGI